MHYRRTFDRVKVGNDRGGIICCTHRGAQNDYSARDEGRGGAEDERGKADGYDVNTQPAGKGALIERMLTYSHIPSVCVTHPWALSRECPMKLLIFVFVEHHPGVRRR